MPKVFISYSWNDKELAMKIASDLKRDGAEIWIDDARIAGGESFTARINEALEWCDTVILLWSVSAAGSRWVNVEWECAKDMDKKIIPCTIDDHPRPAILRNILYIDFKNLEFGYAKLTRALDLELKTEKAESKPNKEKPIPRQPFILPDNDEEITSEYFKNTLATIDRNEDRAAFIDAVFRKEKALNPKQRIETGQVLGKLGDPRRGVGKNEKTGLPDIVWCHIPAGSFEMGSDKGCDDEKPIHEVSLNEFYMSRYPVTQAQFKLFIDAEGYKTENYWSEAKHAKVWSNGVVRGWREIDMRGKPKFYRFPFDLDNHPVVGITWYEALAYCRWLDDRLTKASNITLWNAEGLKTIKKPDGLKVILPSEAEWEYAAHGGKDYEYPWGNEITPDHANYRDTGIDSTSAVGSFPKGENGYGLLDMIGNVWEWTRSHSEKYPYTPKNDREKLVEGTGIRRIIRGGSFSYLAVNCRCANRNLLNTYDGDRLNGFRLVLSPVPDSDL